MTAARHQVSIRFEVRGGFRLVGVATLNLVSVSIRFEVRGSFRRLCTGPDGSRLDRFNPL